MKLQTNIIVAFILGMFFAFPVWAKEETKFDEGKAEKALEQAASDIAKTLEKSEDEVAPEPTLWDVFPPDIQVFMWGEQFRIKVTAHPDMPKDSVGGIQSVKMEKTDGTFLGYRPFAADEPRQAIFMTDPAKIDIQEALITISSTTDGELKRVITFADPADNEIPITAPVPNVVAAAPAKAEETKKKKWFW